MKNSLIVKSVLVAALAVSHAPVQAAENLVWGSQKTCFAAYTLKIGLVKKGYWSDEFEVKFRYVIKDCDATADRLDAGVIDKNDPIFKGKEPSHETCNTNKKFLRGLAKMGFLTDSLMATELGDEKRMCDAFFDEALSGEKFEK